MTLILFLKRLILLPYFFFLVHPDVVTGCKREKTAGKKCVSGREKIVREKKREREENEKKLSFKTSQDVKMSEGLKKFLEHSEMGENRKRVEKEGKIKNKAVTKRGREKKMT